MREVFMKAIVEGYIARLPNNLILWIFFYINQINVTKMTQLNGG